MQAVYSWLERKLRAPRYRLREPFRASETYHGRIGLEEVFGQVTLSAKPARQFSFSSKVTWPVGEQYQAYEQSVLDGVLDVLLLEQTYPVVGVSVTLEEVVWNDLDSSALAYGLAARLAMRHILTPNGEEPNCELLLPAWG
jgi:hypothetical protein